MELWRKIFNARFNELKRSEGLTQAKLAERLDVTPGTIGHWRREERSPRNLKQFRELEKALQLEPGTLTQPDNQVNETAAIYQVSNNKTPYQSSINVDIAEKATAFLISQIGVKGMEEQGPRWVAETIIMLYDLFSDPKAESLNERTIMKMVSNLHRTT